MSQSEPARTPGRSPRPTILPALVAVGVAALGLLGYQSLAGSSPSATSPIATETVPHRPHDRLHGRHQGAPGKADGVVPDGVTVFDDEYPAVAEVDPALLGAVRRAATDAADDGVVFYVDSGWRSPEYQQQLLDEAISKYGSKQEAARWVATPDTSAHVSGNAIDIGHAEATAWLSRHGARYGLCQIYRNEPWHYELRPAAIRHGCPPMYADPTHDPRMQQQDQHASPSSALAGGMNPA
jgi:D-alanyl-D-alanine carboxypeptidase